MSLSDSAVCVIGGGIAGYVFACFLKSFRPELPVKVLERASAPAKRILVSGNGRCNFFNRNLLSGLPDDHIFDNARRLFTPDEGQQAFLGFERLFDIPYVVTDEGLYYPFSNRSDTVYSAVMEKGAKLGVAVEKGDFQCAYPNGAIDYLDEEGKKVTAKPAKAVFALGGQSLDYPKHDLKALARLGLKFKTYTPALCPLKTTADVSRLTGTRVKCLLSLRKGKELCYQENGEVLFRKDSLSGICVFNSSIRIEADKIKHYALELDLRSHDGFRYEITEENIERALPPKLAAFIKDKAQRERTPVSYLASKLRFPLSGLYGFKESQVSKGGIEVSELNPLNLSALRYPSFYFLGEMLDASLPCGGYNIGSCIIEAFKAAKNF